MKKKVIDWVSYTLAGVIALAVFMLVVTFVSEIQSGDSNALGALSIISLVLTSLFGIFYLFYSCKKGIGSTFYVYYMGALAVCNLIAIAGAARLHAVVTVALAVSVAALSLLCFAKDLGQFKSTLFAVLTVWAKLLEIAVYTIDTSDFSIRIVTDLILSVGAFFFVCAKYYDKHERGSK